MDQSIINPRPKKVLERVTRENLRLIRGMDSDNRKRATRNHFGYFLAHYLPTYVQSDFAPFHYDMMGDVHDLVDLRIREVAWFMFGESAKTSFAKALIL